MQITNQNNPEKHIELPKNMIITEVETEPVKVNKKLQETRVMTEINKEHKRSEEPIQEIIIRDMASRMNEESKIQQVKASVEEVIPLKQPEEKAVVKQIQSQNKEEAKKDVDTKPSHREMEEENVSEETLEDFSKTVFMGNVTLESLIREEQFLLNELQNRKRKKVIKDNQLAISQSESSSYEDDAYIKARRSKRRRSKSLKSLTHHTDEATSNTKLERSENLDISVEKSISTEMNTSPQINPEEEKANLERQYYALMKHASRNSIDMQHLS